MQEKLRELTAILLKFLSNQPKNFGNSAGVWLLTNNLQNLSIMEWIMDQNHSMHSQQPSTNNQPHLIMDPLRHLPNKKKKQLLLVSIYGNAHDRIHSASIHEKSKYMVLIVLKSVLLSTLNTRGRIVAFAFPVMQFIHPFID